MLLKIERLTDRVSKYYIDEHKQLQDDIGFDLYVPENHIIQPKEYSHKIKHEIAAEMLASYYHGTEKKSHNVGYILTPRSSFTQYPFVMGNSPGIIDIGYRGDITAVIHNLSDKSFTIEAGSRLFQIVGFNGLPFRVRLVDNLTQTIRGGKGFGSTN